jgi:hypothetical protein
MVVLEEIIRSAHSTAPCEDVFGYRRCAGGLHAWVIDGATSIAATQNQMRADMTDPAWFARAVSRGIFAAVKHGRLEKPALAAVLERLHRAYVESCGERVQLCDYPLAAMTYVHVESDGPRSVVWSLRWADCFLAHRPIAEPVVRPAPRRRLSEVPLNVPYKPLAIERDVLEAMRERRVRQIAEGVGGALTLMPQSAYAATESCLQTTSPLLLLCGSDGFERLWGSYGARSLPDVCDSALAGSLIDEMQRLRDWERENPGQTRELKRADDATVLMVLSGV